jgi:tetratricopeptide (TPR) repeat protein
MAAQWQNHIAAVALKEMHYKKAGRLLKPLQGTLSTSDSYWQNYGRLLFEQKKYATAVTLFNKAKAFTSNPDVYLQIGYCYELTGQMALAEKEFEVAACMLPNRLTPRYALLQLYLRKKDTAAALKQAKEMVVLREKVPSAQAAFFKKEAARVAIKYNAPFNNNITQSQIR